jgi:hypothetical protein
MNPLVVLANLEDKLYDREMAGALWKYFKDTPERDAFLEAYKRVQARKIKRDAAWQAEWRTRCSRRPQRNNHHDSWSIREKYARATLSHYDYTSAHPIASEWSKLRLEQLRKESTVTRREFMENNGFRIRPRDKQFNI